MDKKVKYSKCLATEYSFYRQIYPLYKDWDKMAEHILKANPGSTMQTEFQLRFLKMDMEGQILHVFLKDRFLKDFLINTEIRDYSEVIRFVAEKGIYGEGRTSSHEDVTFAEYRLCIHVPEEESGYTCSLSVDNTNRIRIVLLHNNFVITLDKKQNEPLGFEKSPDPYDQDDYKSWKLIINLIFYMNTFPECVIDGLPKGVRLDYGFKNRKIQIGTSPKIVAKTETSSDGRIVTPHFRSGHFRYLGSDFFTKMRGKTIFIESCFVKGKNVKTVIERKTAV